MGKKRIFVTGGCGFIGANLVKFLLDRDEYNLTVYDNLSAGSKENLKQAISDSKKKGSVRFIKGDILSRNKLDKVTRGHQIIIHLAAHTNVINSLKNPQKDFEVNARGTFNLLEAARENKIKRFIFSSSNAVVGEQTSPIDENKVAYPMSPYGASKLAAEALCSAYYRSFGIKTVILRFANCYGPYSGQKNSVIAKFIKRAKQGKSLEIYGDGTQTRDFIHSEDICRAIHLTINSLSRNNINGTVFQIAFGKETRIIDLATMVKEILLKIGYKPPKIVFRTERRGEIKRNYADISRAKSVLGFKPRIYLKQGLEEVVELFMMPNGMSG